jgi:hypothetical protein
LIEVRDPGDIDTYCVSRVCQDASDRHPLFIYIATQFAEKPRRPG